MRTAFFVAAIVGGAAISPGVLFGVLATAASTLFEATPFILAGIALGRVARCENAAAFLGCGCGSGPAARSIPAAAVTWIVFGPVVAIARLLAATAVARVMLSRWPAVQREAPHRHNHLLGELAALLPAALIAGASMQVSLFARASNVSPFAQLAGGALLGFAASPCGIGAAAVASALHQRAPLAAGAFLCVAGIVDVRALVRRSRRLPDRDAVATSVLALALAIVGLRHGDALVHPALAFPLLCCAAACAAAAVLFRYRRDVRALPAPALMLAGALVAAPPPAYRATETTLSGAFPGEHLTFTGTLVRTAHSAALVRYAITCCRADAAPIVVRLSQRPPFASGTWLRAEGYVGMAGGDVRLVTRRIDRIAPPADPFTYR